MYEIKENRRELFDGTKITTYTRDVVNANVWSYVKKKYKLNMRDRFKFCVNSKN
ncbi:hypothetical protein H6A20_12910 [Mordavella massiliensis]|uniref:Uncharacterized protein n=1 Tax=Mordavella massiliensis TaxID=1871024 RepID=A0A939BIC9_9CLOT|nr:hypothetical protein [Mordavella massiliensis]